MLHLRSLWWDCNICLFSSIDYCIWWLCFLDMLNVRFLWWDYKIRRFALLGVLNFQYTSTRTSWWNIGWDLISAIILLFFFLIIVSIPWSYGLSEFLIWAHLLDRFNDHATWCSALSSAAEPGWRGSIVLIFEMVIFHYLDLAEPFWNLLDFR